MVGKMVKLPITGRLVPIITDEHADPELGSGAVKITPGHDFNDFEVGKRAGFKPAEMLNMLDADAAVCQTADGLIPDALVGMDRFDARKKVVEMIDGEGLLEQVEERVIVTPYGDRSNVVIEPWLTDQWYVDAEKLAEGPIKAVRDGTIDIVPKSWEKTFFNWMENIQPWCVSRQLWWGHRIPAWYGDNGECYVAPDEEAAQTLAGEDVALIRDGDVLDTWFSSGLWPFATLGWPDDAIDSPSSEGEMDSPASSPSFLKEGPGVVAERAGASVDGETNSTTPNPSSEEEGNSSASSGSFSKEGRTVAKPGTDLARHYPNSVLISGFDILFFWDARMMMQGMHFMGEVPFHTLYLHGLVRAADGQKMSKSKGNTVDPLGLIDQYGADALRFFMAAMESQGRDIKMDEKRVEGYRNFATKLWNAARFCQANGIGASTTLKAPSATSPVNRWIISETVETLETLNKAFDDLRFDGAADAVYHFVWDRFCDWYLELIKPVSSAGERGQIDEETRTVAGWVLDQILVMLHPFMPFITEELWHAMGDRSYDIIVAKWPDPRADVDADAGGRNCLAD